MDGQQIKKAAGKSDLRGAPHLGNRLSPVGGIKRGGHACNTCSDDRHIALYGLIMSHYRGCLFIPQGDEIKSRLQTKDLVRV